MAHYRQTVEDSDFVTSRRALNLDVRVLDEILEGVIDVIARVPERFGNSCRHEEEPTGGEDAQLGGGGQASVHDLFRV